MGNGKQSTKELGTDTNTEGRSFIKGRTAFFSASAANISYLGCGECECTVGGVSITVVT